VRTDHAALVYLHKFADNNGRLMRWSLRLANLDFVIEHRPGTKIGHEYALSRHVGAVASEEIISNERILQEQKQDKFCNYLKPGAYSSKN
jgi:hypothetical protein